MRHGESEYNEKRKIQGQKDCDLTEKGMRQARQMTEHYEGREFDAVYSSDLKRALKTAEEFVEDRDTEILIRKELRERSLGEIEGSDSERWKELNPGTDGEWKPEGGENLIEHKERASEILEEILENGFENTIAFTHGGTIRAMIAWIIGSDSRGVWRLKINNCSETVLSYGSDGWRVERVNRELI